MTTFFRILESPADSKAQALLDAARALHDLGKRNEAFQRTVLEQDPTAFAVVPGSPFAYWVNDSLRALFREHPRLEQPEQYARRGSSTGDDFRRVRAWWEVRERESKWRCFAKGGASSRFYSDVHLTAAWDERRGTYVGFLGRAGRETERPEAADEYFRPGLTWPRRTQAGLSLRVMPGGCVFGDKGPATFVTDDSPNELLALLAIMTSAPFRFLVALQMAFGSYEVGVIQHTPVPKLSDGDVVSLALRARRAWSLKRTLDTTNETSHAFVLPPGTLGYEAVAPNEKAGGFNRKEIEEELVAIQRIIDDIAFELYGIGPEDRRSIEASSRSAMDASSPDEDDEDDEDDATIGVAVLPVFSWLVGVAFGRFDPRLATGERPIPQEPEPFDPLPARSPGMWPEGEFRPTVVPTILVDDSGHHDDIWFHVAEHAAHTGWPDPAGLRRWLAKEFFPLHIRMYSKSRRKAPIYWQLATPSACYSVWLYIHAFTKDTLFRVQNDYAAPKLAHEERRLESLSSELRNGATAAQRKQLATQEAFVDELRVFLDEVKRVAPLWNPNLDDGVILNFAPLWRLVPHHKPWQKELKATWDSLCDGKYDWAHLAMHLWPERVVPKCAKDRSLAIAHGLEEVFWAEGSDGKWTARKAPTRSLDELVRERTSPAVKSALESLLAAPGSASTGRKTRKGKAHA